MRAVSAAASGIRHLSGVGLQALIIVGIVAALLLALSPVFGPAEDLAGINGANARGGTAIIVPDGTFAGTTVATVNPGGDAAVSAKCYQDGVAVWAQVVHVDANNQAILTLGPTPRWSGGAADCTAEEGYWSKGGRWRVLASTTFHVSD